MESPRGEERTTTIVTSIPTISPSALESKGPSAFVDRSPMAEARQPLLQQEPPPLPG